MTLISALKHCEFQSKYSKIFINTTFPKSLKIIFGEGIEISKT